MIRKIISFIMFPMILVLLFSSSNDVLIPKETNRYYILEKELQERNETYSVQVYGSCHAYTSFNPTNLIEKYGITSYNLSNPSEIIPVTYLRMAERFKKDSPEVVLVETWGINPYETYIDSELILYGYLRADLERLPLSLAKLEVMHDFPYTRYFEENFSTAKYKDRLLNGEITSADTFYSFDRLKSIYYNDSTQFYLDEMDLRLANHGFKPYPSQPQDDYVNRQAVISPGEELAVEDNLIKYIDKIIQLCQEHDVALIFYRAPYLSTENELRKINYLENYLSQRGIPYYNLEQEISWDYQHDFYDSAHLSETGAQKATEFLCDKLLAYL